MTNYGFNFTNEESVFFERAVGLVKTIFDLEMPEHYKDWTPMHLFAINEVLSQVQINHPNKCMENKAFQTMFVEFQNKTFFRFLQSFPPLSKERLEKSFNNVLKQNKELVDEIQKCIGNNSKREK